MIPEPHPRQAERLEAIERYRLGQQAEDGTLDGLVRLATQLTGCPISLISIVHSDKQIFEARCGLDIESTDLERSVCAHAILGDDILEIEDLRNDPRTADNPFVTDPDDPMRFYAGAQIVTAEGLPLGSFCVLDRVPRRLTPNQREALKILAQQVMQRLDFQEALRQQDAMRREVDHRVKNSLANAAVLTRQAARHAKSDEARETLQVVERRIRVMADLHEDLYRADDPEGAVPVNAYVDRVIGHLRAIAPAGVNVRTDLDPLALSASRASALGVLINEWASNSCKHGFPRNRTGEIVLRGRLVGDGRYRLECADDGVGAPPDDSERGLGSRIIAATASQLGGVPQVSTGPGGYVASVEFSLMPG